MKKIICAFLFFMPFAVFAFDKKNVLSPIEGNWNNKQPLVINAETGTEVYYSFTDSDPYVSGLSYDKPFVIEATGDVCVKIAAISKDGSRKDFSVKYNVNEAINAEYKDATKLFIESINKEPIKEYVSGENFFVPQDFLFSFNNFKEPYLKTSAKVSEQNDLERFVPCTIKDVNNSTNLHFVLSIVAPKKEPLEVLTLPFEISDWANFAWTNKKFIYKIDDSTWTSFAVPATLDRTLPHTIYWQSIEYDKNNEIYEYTLPAKPFVYSKRNEDGSVTFFIEGNENYSFKDGAKVLYVDAFESEDLSEYIFLDLFYNNIKQGQIEVTLNIDKLPPVSPIISLVSNTLPGQRSTSLRIEGLEDSKILYALSEPLVVSDDFKESYDAEFNQLEASNFVDYHGEEISLSSTKDKILLYKIKAYAVDEAGNKSDVVEKNIVIDEVNYYYSSNTISEIQDGSYSEPFTSLEQFLEVAKSSNKKLRLHIYGDLIINKATSIKKDCVFIGHESKIVLDGNASLSILNSSVTFENCYFEKASSSDSNNFIVAENAMIKIIGTDFYSMFVDKGILFDVKKSEVEIKNSRFTTQAASYVCALYAVDSNINCENSSWTSVADSCVNVNIIGGIKGKTNSFINSNFDLIGNLGRGIMLSQTNASICNNNFVGRFSLDTKNSYPIWSDKSLLKEQNNNQKGF